MDQFFSVGKNGRHGPRAIRGGLCRDTTNNIKTIFPEACVLYFNKQFFKHGSFQNTFALHEDREQSGDIVFGVILFNDLVGKEVQGTRTGTFDRATKDPINMLWSPVQANGITARSKKLFPPMFFRIHIMGIIVLQKDHGGIMVPRHS